MKKIFSELIQDFLSDIDAGEAQYRTYRNALVQFGKFMNTKKIKSFKHEYVIEFRETLRAESKCASTIQLYLVALRRFFSWMTRKGYLKEPIMEGIKMPKTSTDFVKAHLSAEQAKQLLDSIDQNSLKGKRDYALIALMLTTGIRTVEAARANIHDISSLSSGPVLFIQGKGHDAKDNYVKISDTVIDALNTYFEARKIFQSTKVLFASISRRNSAQRLSTRSISRIVKERLQDIGLNDRLLSAHSLRHTAATLNLLAGGTLEETQQLLRHKSLTTTIRYSHALKRETNNSEARITSAIFS